MKRILLPLLFMSVAAHTVTAQIKDYYLTSGTWYPVAAGIPDLANGMKLIAPSNSLGGITLTLPSTNGSSGYVLTTDGAGALSWMPSSGGSGTVTSISQTVPSIMSVSGSPITTSGTLAISLATESANFIFAGPTTGSPATPTFRALVAADMPSGSGGYIQNGTSLQTSANFNIDGHGSVGTYLLTPDLVFTGTGSGVTGAGMLYNGISAVENLTQTNGQLIIGYTGSAPQTATLTQGEGAIIANGSGSIAVSDSIRTFAQYQFVSGTSFTITSANLSSTTNIVVENAGATSVTIPAAIRGVEIFIYRSVGSFTTTVALGSGAHFVGGQTSLTIPATTGAGVRLLGVVNGYWLIDNIP